MDNFDYLIYDVQLKVHWRIQNLELLIDMLLHTYK